jgi:hypothetical protein
VVAAAAAAAAAAARDAHRACRHRAGRVAAGAGLGHAERADQAAVAEPRQEAAPLVLRAVEVDVIRAKVVVRGVRDAEARVRVRELLRYL